MPGVTGPADFQKLSIKQGTCHRTGYIYRPCDYVFTDLCLSVHGGGVCLPHCMLGYTPLGSACWDTVFKRAVRILLECILVRLI